MKLELNSLAVDCVIGELPEERNRVQRLVIDIALEIPDTVSESDELSDTVDYAALAGDIRAALVDARCRMIERAAKVVADVCMKETKVLSATVRVSKPGVIEQLASASATLTISRTEAGI